MGAIIVPPTTSASRGCRCLGRRCYGCPRRRRRHTASVIVSVVIMVTRIWTFVAITTTIAVITVVPALVAVAPSIILVISASVIAVITMMISSISITSMIAVAPSPLTVVAAIPGTSARSAKFILVVSVAFVVIVFSSPPAFLLIIIFVIASTIIIVVFFAPSPPTPSIIVAVVVVSMGFRLALRSLQGFAVQTTGMGWCLARLAIVFLAGLVPRKGRPLLLFCLFASLGRRQSVQTQKRFSDIAFASIVAVLCSGL